MSPSSPPLPETPPVPPSPKGPQSSSLFITNALNKLAGAKEARRNRVLQDSVATALEAAKHPSISPGDMALAVYPALRLACVSDIPALMVTSLDCLEKLISYDYIDEAKPESDDSKDPSGEAVPSPVATESQKQEAPGVRLIDDLVEVTCECFIGEGTDDAVTMQIIKALLAAVLSETSPIHEAILLRAVRTIYNVFLLSRSTVNQTIAQGTLTQMVNVVFGRVNIHEERKRRSEILAEPSPPTSPIRKSSSSSSSSSSSPSPSASKARPRRSSSIAHALSSGAAVRLDSRQDIAIRDAFLLFRSLCKLSMKPISTDGATDLKSLSMRTKLLALHLILDILDTHLPVFLMPTTALLAGAPGEGGGMADGPGGSASPTSQTVTTTFINAVKQYLCLSLSRNIVSVVPAVFDCALETFWRVLSGLRSYMKKEIEVFFKEIFLPILEMKNSSLASRKALLGILSKMCKDPQLLVEIYLNYDCDGEALDNIYERLVNVLAKLASSHTQVGPSASISSSSSSSFATGPTPSSSRHRSYQPSLTTASVSSSLAAASSGQAPGGPGVSETGVKHRSLEALVSILSSLVEWASRTDERYHGPLDGPDDLHSSGPGRMFRSSSRARSIGKDSGSGGEEEAGGEEGEEGGEEGDPSESSASPEVYDDPQTFGSQKQRKQQLQHGIKMFNWNMKKGMKLLLSSGCIPNDEPKTIARFLLTTEGLSKSMIGEFLGEPDPKNVEIMHAFVDYMNFRRTSIVDALRQFLQSFRLPGEAQKIDRFMLKFAERYIQHNPGTFANADTAYVLAFSIIMLNTDMHSMQVKNRMTKAEFLRNNRGIDDGSDLPAEYLESIYEDIGREEIRMKEEVQAESMRQLGGKGGDDGAISSGARATVSAVMGNKTEQLLRSMARSNGSNRFHAASSGGHVRPMFELGWMAFLAALSSPLQDPSEEDGEVVRVALRGFTLSIHIIGLYDLELERDAFISTLAKCTMLGNLREMRWKHVLVVRSLLDMALTEGNALGRGWYDVLVCISQLERFQSIADAIGVTPTAGAHSSAGGPKSTLFTSQVAAESRSQSIVVAVDRLFNSTIHLTGGAIVEFVDALCRVSWEEIQASAELEHPRMYSLQKLVEISYYNMGRIRMEWSRVWSTLGEHFNQVGTHANQNAAFFALDSLRQLSMKFLEKEELEHFRFQREFLRPFQFILVHNRSIAIKDMVLRCVGQLITAGSSEGNIRSGWRTALAVYGEAAKETHEAIVLMAFDAVRSIYLERYQAVRDNGSLPDLMGALVEFARNSHRFQKTALQAIELYRPVLSITSPTASASPTEATGAVTTASSPTEVVWYPILHGLYQVVMDSADLEVRTRALDDLFEAVEQHGHAFPESFWQLLFESVLFPLFNDLKQPGRRRRFSNEDEMTVWLSTTLVKALRKLIGLFGHYREILRPRLEGVLQLLRMCIEQGDETLARIGCSCLQDLVEENCDWLDEAAWKEVGRMLVLLFRSTSPMAVVVAAGGRASPALAEKCGAMCTVQLILLETVEEMLLRDVRVGEAMGTDGAFLLIDATARAYRHAQKFNRTAAPSLLGTDGRGAPGSRGLTEEEGSKMQVQLVKQELGCLGCCVRLLLLMHRRIQERSDKLEERGEDNEKKGGKDDNQGGNEKAEIERRLLP
ncbi:MAG: Sec7-domain-containing protein [Piptocephalis tieghemiana]|nr:MAG: Sec7-domain-containing protein [Piptocephalis tieghemiana]